MHTLAQKLTALLTVATLDLAIFLVGGVVFLFPAVVASLPFLARVVAE